VAVYMFTLVYNLLLGGFIVGKSELPPKLEWMIYTSYFWYGFQCLMINEFGDKDYGKKVLKELDMYFEDKWIALAILALMWLLFQVATFFTLLFFNKEKR